MRGARFGPKITTVVVVVLMTTNHPTTQARARELLVGPPQTRGCCSRHSVDDGA